MQSFSEQVQFFLNLMNSSFLLVDNKHNTRKRRRVFKHIEKTRKEKPLLMSLIHLLKNNSRKGGNSR